MAPLYLKSLHIIFVVTWFAGLFYIVRLFIYHREAFDKSPESTKNINPSIRPHGKDFGMESHGLVRDFNDSIWSSLLHEWFPLEEALADSEVNFCFIFISVSPLLWTSTQKTK